MPRTKYWKKNRSLKKEDPALLKSRKGPMEDPDLSKNRTIPIEDPDLFQNRTSPIEDPDLFQNRTKPTEDPDLFQNRTNIRKDQKYKLIRKDQTYKQFQKDETCKQVRNDETFQKVHKDQTCKQICNDKKLDTSVNIVDDFKDPVYLQSICNDAMFDEHEKKCNIDSENVEMLPFISSHEIQNDSRTNDKVEKDQRIAGAFQKERTIEYHKDIEKEMESFHGQVENHSNRVNKECFSDGDSTKEQRQKECTESKILCALRLKIIVEILQVAKWTK
ncbi:uncharacterized protein [Ptychodera flava]|uniref:uncharacterized protein n=1 Tax=Ptychodera flava TaxID=63121 RepID=UPI003969F24B